MDSSFQSGAHQRIPSRLHALSGQHVKSSNQYQFQCRFPRYDRFPGAERQQPPVHVTRDGRAHDHYYELGDNVTLSVGSHNFKTGFQGAYVWLDRGAANVPRGDMNFTDNVGANAFASFLLGYPETSDTPEGLPLTYPRQFRYGAYFQ